jgi:hypothetical protein
MEDFRKNQKKKAREARREGGAARGRGGKRCVMDKAGIKNANTCVYVIWQREGEEQRLDNGAEGVATCSSKAMRRKRPIESTAFAKKIRQTKIRQKKSQSHTIICNAD